MIQASIIDEVRDSVWSKVADSVSWINEYVLVTEVVVAALVALIVLGLLGHFAPFDWAKKLFGWIGSMVIAGAAAAIWMWKMNRGENRKLRDEIQKLKSRKEEDQPKGWHW